MRHRNLVFTILSKTPSFIFISLVNTLRCFISWWAFKSRRKARWCPGTRWFYSSALLKALFSDILKDELCKESFSLLPFLISGKIQGHFPPWLDKDLYKASCQMFQQPVRYTKSIWISVKSFKDITVVLSTSEVSVYTKIQELPCWLYIYKKEKKIFKCFINTSLPFKWIFYDHMLFPWYLGCSFYIPVNTSWKQINLLCLCLTSSAISTGEWQKCKGKEKSGVICFYRKMGTITEILLQIVISISNKCW